jgi:hypothetical protein
MLEAAHKIVYDSLPLGKPVPELGIYVSATLAESTEERDTMLSVSSSLAL